MSSETSAPVDKNTRVPVHAPPPESLWLGAGRALLVVLFVAVLFTPGYVYADDRYWLPLFSRYMAVALFALSVDLVWGYTGLLSLGQGLYFGIGVYAVGYSLMFQTEAKARGLPLVAQAHMPKQALLSALPDWSGHLVNIWLALAVAVLLPALVAFAFGAIAFRRRIKGVYFSLITQALLLAVFTLVDNQLPYTGGTVGMPNLRRLELFGHEFTFSEQFYLTTAMLGVCFAACLLLVHTKFGKVLTAIRDSEYRVLALGYNTAMYKTAVYTLAGGIAGLAGALYVSALRTAGPDVLQAGFSIEVVILVAVGGRGTLFGAVLGAILVNYAKTLINDQFSVAWPIILGLLFVLVVVFLPEGILGGLRALRRRVLPAPGASA